MKTVLGERLLPSSLADRYLARTAFEGQVTDDPIDEDRPDILFEPAGVDLGARGPFGEQALERSIHYAVNRRRGPIAAFAALLAAGAWLAARHRR